MRLHAFANSSSFPILRVLGHAIADVSVKYHELSEQYDIYSDWAIGHSGIVIHDRMSGPTIDALYTKLEAWESAGMLLPFGTSTETDTDIHSEPGAIAGISVILPNRYYKFKQGSLKDLSLPAEDLDLPAFVAESTTDGILNTSTWTDEQKSEFTKAFRKCGYLSWEIELMLEIYSYPLIEE